jgi:hypothetical protein
MRMHPLALLTALALGAATAFLVACGSSDNLIPSNNASSIENALSQVSSDFQAGRCQAAEQAVSKLNGELVNLPDSVDPRLRSRLKSGVSNLDARVRATCTETQQQQQTQTQTQQQTQTNQQTDTNTKTQTDTGTTDTGTTGTGTTDTGKTDTGTTGTGTTDTGTTPGDTATGDTTGGVGAGG